MLISALAPPPAASQTRPDAKRLLTTAAIATALVALGAGATAGTPGTWAQATDANMRNIDGLGLALAAGKATATLKAGVYKVTAPKGGYTPGSARVRAR